jgi:deoxyribonuclease V
MIAALDVHYDDAKLLGIATSVVFENWGDAAPVAEHTAVVEKIQPYVPGQFFRRELPCLLAVIAKIRQSLDTIVVDSYVDLDQKPGLGRHLFEQLSSRIAVIGVAKTQFHGACALEVLRGDSQKPLFVTAAGIAPKVAATCIKEMHGPHRIPTLLKRVDQLGRTGMAGSAGPSRT